MNTKALEERVDGYIPKVKKRICYTTGKPNKQLSAEKANT